MGRSGRSGRDDGATRHQLVRGHMPLTRQDAIEITQQLESLLRQYDPFTFEIATSRVERGDDPRRNLLGMLGLVIRIYSEKSSGLAAQALDRINHHVRLPNGEPITGIMVELSPSERELYGREEVDLATVPDRTEFISDLKDVFSAIADELERSR